MTIVDGVFQYVTSQLRDHLSAWSATCRLISTYRLLSINRPLSQEV